MVVKGAGKVGQRWAICLFTRDISRAGASPVPRECWWVPLGAWQWWQWFPRCAWWWWFPLGFCGFGVCVGSGGGGEGWCWWRV